MQSCKVATQGWKMNGRQGLLKRGQRLCFLLFTGLRKYYAQKTSSVYIYPEMYHRYPNRHWQHSPLKWSDSGSKALFLSFGRGRKRGRREREILSRLHAQHRAGSRAQSHDSEIINWMKTKNQTNWTTKVPEWTPMTPFLEDRCTILPFRQHSYTFKKQGNFTHMKADIL